MGAYYPGGFHPTHIGDAFKDGRYIIVHKLGTGTFASVWLANDLNTKTYVSLKILAADAADWSGNPQSVDEELKILSILRDSTLETPSDFVPRLLDHFFHTGPNGTHQCIVTELLGPNLSSAAEEGYLHRLSWQVKRSIIKEVAYALRFLHRNNVVHGDLQVRNILLTCDKLSSMGTDDIAQYYGEVETEDLTYSDDHPRDEAPPHAPLYYICRPDPEPPLRLCLSNHADVRIKLCDFGESSILTKETQPKWANIPFMYQPPEVMLRQPSTPAFEADIWALAVLFYFIATGGHPLFSLGSSLRAAGEDEILKDIVLRVGKLPDPLWSEWKTRADNFDEDDVSLEGDQAGTKPLLPSRPRMPDGEERILFEQMLKSMLVLEPAMRASIDEVIESEWFDKYCARH